MTAKGAVMNYDFGPKRNWRRWVWNRIAERTSVRDASLILYLPGEQDFDRNIALSKGFRSSSLIGVERSDDTRKSLRSGGTLTIDGDIFASVDAISRKRRVDVAVMDLCCGLRAKHADCILNWLLTRETLKGCVFAVNMMRGRDADSNELRQRLLDVAPGEGSTKHRGELLALAMLLAISNDEQSKLATDREWIGRCMVVGAAMRSAFFSYKSESGQVFDSCVFVNPASVLGLRVTFDGKPIATFKELMTKPADPTNPFLDNSPAFVRTSRSAAAVLAHRTRRLQDE